MSLKHSINISHTNILHGMVLFFSKKVMKTFLLILVSDIGREWKNSL